MWSIGKGSIPAIIAAFLLLAASLLFVSADSEETEEISVENNTPLVIGSQDIEDMNMDEVRIDKELSSVSDYEDLSRPSVNRKFSDTYGIPTRASDEEGENFYGDFPNGSVFLTPSDDVSGNLKYDPDGEEHDWIDWFKLDADTVNPMANAVDGKWVCSFQIDSYSSTSPLYEYKNDSETGEMVSEYGDMLKLIVLYGDYWGGISYMGGTSFFYDNGDDTDGWEHDSNWTFEFDTPIPTYTDEDKNGWEDNLTEIGWYYLGLSFDFYIDSEPVNREGYTIDYQFNMDTSGRNDTDMASNDWWNATTAIPDGEKVVTSTHDQIDWYKLEGSDSDKIRATTFIVNRTYGMAGVAGEIVYDTFLNVYFLFYLPGDDEEWNTDDDYWGGFHNIVSYGLTGGGFTNRTVGYTITDRDLDKPHREVYVGVQVEPAKYTQEGDRIIFFDPYIPTFANYTMDVSIVEEYPNRRPSLSNLEIESDYPQEEIGGNLDSEFTINITYTDPDGDPPADLKLVIDPNTPDQTEINITDQEADPADTDYTDGKVYTHTLKGSDVGESDDPHHVMAYVSDMISGDSIRLSRISADIYENQSFVVWDDSPIRLNNEWEGLDPLYEDQSPVQMNLQSIYGGPFEDPENSFVGFSVKNSTTGKWGDSFDSELIRAEIIEESSLWNLKITPKEDMHGELKLQLMAEDAHSSKETEVKVTVQPVNDPPVIEGVELDGRTFEAEHLTGRYRLDLTSAEVLEDGEFTFRVLANDEKDDNTDLTFSIDEARSGNWKGPLNIREATGEVKFIPTNDDVAIGEDSIMVTVSDGGEDSIAELEVMISVTNTNDPPSITIPDIPLEYDQYEEIWINPVTSDPDREDILTVDVNVFRSIEGEDPLVDVLDEARLERGVDWDIIPETGRFYLKVDDHAIWNSSGETLERREITLIFSATDREGSSNTASVDLVLNNLNEEPPPPLEIDYVVPDQDPDTPGTQGLNVTLSVEPVIDPDGDELTYHWIFDDGTTDTGEEVDHSFNTAGTHVVRVYASDGEYNSMERSVEFELFDVPEPEEEPDNGDDGFNILFIVIPLLLAILLAALVIIFLVMKGRKTVSDEGDKSACPNCGAEVEPDWVVCPECNSRLD